MRIAHLMAYFIFCSTVSTAKTMTWKQVMDQSAELKKTISSAKTLEAKKIELKKWEDILQSTLKSYETESPKEGKEEEDLVGKYFISLEPVFDFAKETHSKENCRKAEHQIKLEDRDNTKKDPSLLTDDAKEALAILKLLCVY